MCEPTFRWSVSLVHQQKIDNMMQLQCLAAIMRGAFNEIYIFDADTLGFIETS